MGKNNIKSTTTEFIQKANIVHNNFYMYEKVQYINSDTKVTITCPIHGDFKQVPYHHLAGRGCKQCGVEKTKKARNVTTQTIFLEKAKQVFGETYDYSKVKYTNSTTKVVITCKEHGDFSCLPSKHMCGRGCPSCAKTGFDNNKPGILYYLKINNGEAYKIGITNKSIETRFSPAELTKIEVVNYWEYTSGQMCRDTEQKILNECKEYKYIGEKLLLSGHTEMFSKDISNEIKRIINGS